MADKIVIQSPVQRSESIRARLAELAWTEGLSAFVTNGVPFSFSSGRVLAGGVAHIVNALAKQARAVSVVELGAGIGYLSAFCLDSLKDQFPDAYSRSEFVVTDGGPALVRDAESRGVLARHPDRARHAVADLRDKPSILKHQPQLILMSYLVDAIPPRHVERRADGLYTARIETSIPDDVAIVDAGLWPPRILQANQLVEILQSSIEAMPPALARKVVPHLAETWSWVPEETEVVPGVMLNSRAEIVRELCALLGEMPGDSAIVVTDFGYTASEEIELNEMMTEYGLCAFWAVAFDEIASIAAECGFTTRLCAGEEGETHTLLVCRCEDPSTLCEAFDAGFEGMVSDRPRFVLYNLEEDCKLDDVQEAIEKIEKTMPEEDVNSYGNLARLAHLLLKFGDVERALSYAGRCVALFPEVAAPEMTILGSAKGREGDLAEAEALFTRATGVAPGYANAYLGLSGVYRARKDWDSYFGCMKDYLRTADVDVIEVMKGIGKTLEDTELESVAEEAKAWVLLNAGE